MQRIIEIRNSFFALVASLFLFTSGTAPELLAESPEAEYHTIWFRLKPETNFNTILHQLQQFNQNKTLSVGLLFPRHQHTAELRDIYEAHFTTEAGGIRALAYLKNFRGVIYAEPRPVFNSFYTPNDLLTAQWHLAKINAQNAWNITRGSGNVTVAIVDDFFDVRHPDLKNSWLYNTLETPDNGIDDDGNGYVDDYAGWHAGYNIPNILPPVSKPASFSHGTHCAGIVGAETDNGLGIASIGFGIKILAVAVGDSTNPGKMTNAFQGIVYAVDRGVQILSISWGTYVGSSTGQLVIDYAHNKGLLIFAAAGNDNTDMPAYPGGYNHVIAVAATDSNDIKSSFSNYGNWVDLSAPGSMILSTISGGMPAYGTMSGTSMATPLAAGLAALIWSYNPQLMPADVEAILRKTAFNHYPSNSSFSGKLGAGRIDAGAAMKSVVNLKALFTENKNSICPKDTIKFKFSGYGKSLTYQWSFPGGSPSTSSLSSPQVVYTNPGTYDVQLMISDGSRADTLLKKTYIQVSIPTASLSADTVVAQGNTLFLNLGFTGSAPWTVGLKMVDSTRWFTANHTPFYIEHQAHKSGVFKILQFSDARCSAAASDSVKVRVYTPPSPGPDSCFVSVNKKRIQTLFSYAYGSAGKEAPTGLIVLRDSNYLLFGTTTGFGAGGEDLWLSKIRRNGQIIWTRTIGQMGFDGGLPVNAKEMSNGDITIVGASATGSGKWQGTVVRLTSAGAVRWSRIYPVLSAHDHLRGLTELPDKSTVVVGTSGYPANQSASLIRFTANGFQTWKKMHDFNGVSEHYLDVHHVNNRLYLFGTASRGTGGVSSIMTKTNLNGDKIWEYRYETSGGNLLMYAVPAADNSGFACAGYGFTSGSSSNVQAHISYVDTNGTVLWMKDFGGTGIERLTAITRGSDQEFYAIGWTQSTDAVSKLMVIRFDKYGNIKWDRVYGSKGVFHNTPDFGAGIARDINDGIVTASAYNQSNPDALILSVNHCGASNCYSEKAGFTYRTLSVTRTNAQTTELNGNTPANWSVNSVSNNSSLTRLDLCPKIEQVTCDLTAAFTFTPECIGDTLRFLNTSKDAHGYPLSFFSWSIDDSIYFAGTRNLAHSFSRSGKHKVTLYAWSREDYFCKDTFVHFISVSDSLKVRASGNSGLCIGDSIRLAAKASCGKHPLKFRWFRHTTVLGDSAVVSFAPGSDGWYRVRVTDAANQSSEDSIYVTVDPACCKHHATLAITGNPWRCEGDSATFGNLSVNAPGTTYHWRYQTPYGIITHTGMSSIPLHAKQAGTYKVRLIAESNVCKSDTAIVELRVFGLPMAVAGPDTFLCTPDSVILGAPEKLYQHTYSWTPENNVDKPFKPRVKAYAARNTRFVLQVRNEVTGCTNKDSVNIDVLDKYYFRMDTSICEGDTLTVRHLAPEYLKWNNGMTANPHLIYSAGLYWLTPPSSMKCPPSDTIKVRVKPLPPVPILTGDTALCLGGSVEIYPSMDTTLFTAKWHDGSTQFRRVFNTAGLKRIAISWDGCVNYDAIKLISVSPPTAPRLRDTSICAGDSFQLKLPEVHGHRYSWSDGFVGALRTFKNPGLYRLDVSNQCGQQSSQLTVSFKNIQVPEIHWSNDTGFCFGENVALNFSAPGTTYSWRDGYSGGNRVIDKPGLYILQAENECYSITDSIRLYYLDCDCEVFLPSAFTPQADGLNDSYTIHTNCFLEDFEINIYNRWGERLFKSSNILAGWDGRYQGSFCPDGVYVVIVSGVISHSGIRRNYTTKGTFHLIR